MKATGRLPKGFVLAKPLAQESYNEGVLNTLIEQGKLIITRKRDGWRILAVFGPAGKVRLYTDGLNEIDARLDHLKRELEQLSCPFGTVVIGEALADLDGKDDLTKVISVFQSSLEKAIQFQEQNGWIKLMIFGAIFPGEGGVLPYVIFYELFRATFFAFNLVYTFDHVFFVPRLWVSLTEAKKMVVKKGWEGLVLYDADYRFTYRLDGKRLQRPEGCYKWKPILEDDFIVREWRTRPGTRILKDLVLLQIDPTTGKEFECGKVGSFGQERRRQLSQAKYPLVVQVAFEMRFVKSGKIRNGRFLRVRNEKPLEHCQAPQSYPQAQFSKIRKKR